MKTLKDFLVPIKEDEGDKGPNKQNHSHPMDPPAILIMRRKSIRQFPNGQRVAMYFVDKINKYVTVPYTAMQWSSALPEEVIIGDLTAIRESGEPLTFEFEDGSIEVSVNEADTILNVYSKLNEENKQKVLELSESKNGFEKLIDFALSYTQ
jgi:hypothetical protein